MNADEQAIVNALENEGVLSAFDGPPAHLTEAERKRVAAVVAPLIEAARNSRPNKGEVLAVISTCQSAGWDIASHVEKLFTDREPAPFRTPGFDGVEGTEYGERDWRA